MSDLFADATPTKRYGNASRGCMACKGVGFDTLPSDSPFVVRWIKCPTCKGCGRVYLDPIPEPKKR